MYGESWGFVGELFLNNKKLPDYHRVLFYSICEIFKPLLLVQYFYKCIHNCLVFPFGTPVKIKPYLHSNDFHFKKRSENLFPLPIKILAAAPPALKFKSHAFGKSIFFSGVFPPLFFLLPLQRQDDTFLTSQLRHCLN
ncbi:hypothetical protein A7A78_01645 [Aequorivita soesokkakensis]|uniref:Uncharacterized protein n=1 Tax=Aequorivita soesokkakensis TaxID=1385699 RepID=A0A1A9LH21_9FLAO|nr:hypothetical protein A7A78_01645 [Aequorivita soesokkakensis]